MPELSAVHGATAPSSAPRSRDTAVAWCLLAPALALLFTFGLLPLGYAVYLSLFRYSRTGDVSFAGLENYTTALASGDFWNSVAVTLYYALGAIPAALALSFFAANLLFRITRFAGPFRTIFFLPYVTSVVASAMVWRELFEPNWGLVNTLFSTLGLPSQRWLLEPRGVLHLLTNGAVPPGFGPSLALCCVILFEIWHSTGFMIVVFLAGLAAVPRELEESARLDGAGAWGVARYVTLPMLGPTVAFLVVVSTIGAFQSFNHFYALTGGGRGPLDTTQNMAVYVYSNFYEYGRIGYGAAAATLLCAAIAALTFLQWRYFGRRAAYR